MAVGANSLVTKRPNCGRSDANAIWRLREISHQPSVVFVQSRTVKRARLDTGTGWPSRRTSDRSPGGASFLLSGSEGSDGRYSSARHPPSDSRRTPRVPAVDSRPPDPLVTAGASRRVSARARGRPPGSRQTSARSDGSLRQRPDAVAAGVARRGRHRASRRARDVYQTRRGVALGAQGLGARAPGAPRRAASRRARR